jgi:hypothetical protein
VYAERGVYSIITAADPGHSYVHHLIIIRFQLVNVSHAYRRRRSNTQQQPHRHFSNRRSLLPRERLRMQGRTADTNPCNLARVQMPSLSWRRDGGVAGMGQIGEVKILGRHQLVEIKKKWDPELQPYLDSATNDNATHARHGTSFEPHVFLVIAVTAEGSLIVCESAHVQLRCSFHSPNCLANASVEYKPALTRLTMLRTYSESLTRSALNQGGAESTSHTMESLSASAPTLAEDLNKQSSSTIASGQSTSATRKPRVNLACKRCKRRKQRVSRSGLDHQLASS